MDMAKSAGTGAVMKKKKHLKKIHNSLFDFSAGGNMVYHF